MLQNDIFNRKTNDKNQQSEGYKKAVLMFQTVVSSQTAAKTTRQQEHSCFESQKDTFGGKTTLN